MRVGHFCVTNGVAKRGMGPVRPIPSSVLVGFFLQRSGSLPGAQAYDNGVTTGTVGPLVPPVEVPEDPEVPLELLPEEPDVPPELLPEGVPSWSPSCMDPSPQP